MNDDVKEKADPNRFYYDLVALFDLWWEAAENE